MLSSWTNGIEDIKKSSPVCRESLKSSLSQTVMSLPYSTNTQHSKYRDH